MQSDSQNDNFIFVGFFQNEDSSDSEISFDSTTAEDLEGNESGHEEVAEESMSEDEVSKRLIEGNEMKRLMQEVGFRQAAAH